MVALVLMPREAFSAEVRQRIQNVLQNRLKGKLLYYYLAMGEDYTARLHFCFYAQPPSAALVRKVEAEIAALARTWDDRLRELFGQTIRRHPRPRDARAMGPRVRASIQGRF